MFVLPAHTSHLLQPLDVGCFGPFQRIYDSECHKFIRQTSTVITQICSIACRVYFKALSPENLHSAFRKTGIYPFNNSVLQKESTMPAEVFQKTKEKCTQSADMPASSDVTPAEQNKENTASPRNVFNSCLEAIFKAKSSSSAKHSNHIGKIVSGKPITEPDIQQKIVAHQAMNSKCTAKKTKANSAVSGKDGACASGTKRMKVTKSSKSPAKPGPSHIYMSDSDVTDDDQIEENEKCCVCKQFTPSEVRNSTSIIFTKWAKCDGIECPHWVHLRYCTQVTVIRRGDKFYCPHCPEDPVEE